MDYPAPYKVYVAEFSFLDSNQAKLRPVVIVSSPYGKHRAVAAIPISSSADKEVVDVNIEDWLEAGLLKESIARIHRLSVISPSDIVSLLGSLSKKDVDSIKISLKKYLDI